MAPVASVLMRLGYQGKETKNFSKQRDFFKLGNYHCEKAYMLFVKTSNVILLPADVWEESHYLQTAYFFENFCISGFKERHSHENLNIKEISYQQQVFPF